MSENWKLLAKKHSASLKTVTAERDKQALEALLLKSTLADVQEQNKALLEACQELVEQIEYTAATTFDHTCGASEVIESIDLDKAKAAIDKATS